ncbi:uncharacterized protein LDX57_007458 [Aspergillus melleus]|uniref:uncharacterized protein n=1 Tax=Aspergillus melleus TaxID=138277 RepID=UPI001E8E4B2A|nr:uncharacterized protein LDX57_007458 [Aspergillus melleus]KAH8429786.1 hypothetical protein LDX57_007458 [Aspergillus melleus]
MNATEVPKTPPAPRARQLPQKHETPAGLPKGSSPSEPNTPTKDDAAKTPDVRPISPPPIKTTIHPREPENPSSRTWRVSHADINDLTPEERSLREERMEEEEAERAYYLRHPHAFFERFLNRMLSQSRDHFGEKINGKLEDEEEIDIWEGHSDILEGRV